MLVVLLSVLLGVSSDCTCKDIRVAYANSPIYFFGKIGAGNTVTVNSVINGNLAVGKAITYSSSCPVEVGKNYLIAAKAGSPIEVTCLVAQSAVLLPQQAFLRQQMIGGASPKCVDGSPLVECDAAVACAMKGCTGATKCSVNRCGGCTPQYSLDSGIRTCLANFCPDGSAPVKCRVNVCANAKPPAACPNAKCVQNMCNGCSPMWVDASGKQICPKFSVSKMCSNVAAVKFGPGKISLGFAVKNGVCSEITGSSAPSSVPLFGSLTECVKMCQCRDISAVDVGSGAAVWWGMAGGACKKFTGAPAVKKSLGFSSFADAPSCQASCVAASTSVPSGSLTPVTNPGTIATPPPPRPPVTGIRTSCKIGSTGCCPDGLTQEVCVDQNVGVYCQFLKCGSQVPKRCVADPCNACKPTVYGDKNVVIANNKCTLNLPEYAQCNPLASVKCPSNIPLECGPKPSGCPANWNARCIIDPCSCKPVWMNEDLRQPSASCLTSLVAKCVVNSDCPAEFQCMEAPNQDEIIKALPSGFKLQCIQETCTCSPTWIQAPVGGAFIPGVVSKCKSGSTTCCPNGLYEKQNCDSLADNTRRTCQQMKCKNVAGQDIVVGTCEPDPCNDCNVRVTDDKKRVVDVNSCTFGPEIGTTCPFNPSIKCPASVTATCTPLTDVCPPDWRLSCVIDPCLCRPFWLDTDVRYTRLECSRLIEPPCIPPQDCPQLSCTPVPEEMKQALGPDVVKTLVCIQEQCTCRPLWVPAQVAQQQMGMMGMMGMPGMMGPPGMPSGQAPVRPSQGSVGGRP